MAENRCHLCLFHSGMQVGKTPLNLSAIQEKIVLDTPSTNTYFHLPLLCDIQMYVSWHIKCQRKSGQHGFFRLPVLEPGNFKTSVVAMVQPLCLFFSAELLCVRDETSPYSHRTEQCHVLARIWRQLYLWVSGWERLSEFFLLLRRMQIGFLEERADTHRHLRTRLLFQSLFPHVVPAF